MRQATKTLKQDPIDDREPFYDHRPATKTQNSSSMIDWNELPVSAIMNRRRPWQFFLNTQPTKPIARPRSTPSHPQTERHTLQQKKLNGHHHHRCLKNQKTADIRWTQWTVIRLTTNERSVQNAAGRKPHRSIFLRRKPASS